MIRSDKPALLHRGEIVFLSFAVCFAWSLNSIPHRDDTLNSDGKQGTAPGESRHTPARACRLVLLTSKGATVCRVCAISRPSPPALSPSFPALGRPPSPGYSERRSPTPPSPSSLSTASAGHGQRKNHLSGQSRPSGGQSRLSSGLGVDSISAGSVAGDHEHLDVFLWQSCRFNQDLLLASITRYVREGFAVPVRYCKFLCSSASPFVHACLPVVKLELRHFCSSHRSIQTP